MSSRMEWRRGGSRVGLFATVAIHALIVLILLSNHMQTQTAPVPTMARIISDTNTEQIKQEPMRTTPKLNQPQIHVPQPEIILSDLAPTQTAPVNVSSSPPAQSEPRQTTEATAESIPRFDAEYLNNPAPRYPAVSRRLREQGVVVLRVYVLASGMPDVVELKQSSGSGRLDTAAQEAVRKWNFVPAQRAGAPVGAWVIVPIEFSLTQ